MTGSDTGVIDRPTAPRKRVDSTDLFCALLVLAVLAKLLLSSELSRAAVQAWTTVFVAICVQASPFVVLGVTVSTAIAVFLPSSFLARALPKRQLLAVPVAGLAGGLLPGCECGSVPIAASLSRRGVRAGPALAFLLSAPAINPVVLVATSVAFAGHPMVVLARFVASLVTSWVVGWVWAGSGRSLPQRNRPEHEHGSGELSMITRAIATASHDLAQTLGLLVVGAASAATLKAVVPQSWLGDVAGNWLTAILALAVLAVLMAICSESDAFIAASLTQFSLTARLVFMVVGPAVDVKLIAMQAGTFGRAFTIRFAPLSWLVAVLVAAVTGAVLL